MYLVWVPNEFLFASFNLDILNFETNFLVPVQFGSKTSTKALKLRRRCLRIILNKIVAKSISSLSDKIN